MFLLAAIAPLVLIYIVLRDHELSWPRGEMTAVIAIIAFGLIGYLGLVDRPGEPPGEISLQCGWFGAMLGVILMMAGGAHPRRRHRATSQATRSPLTCPRSSPTATSPSSSYA